MNKSLFCWLLMSFLVLCSGAFPQSVIIRNDNFVSRYNLTLKCPDLVQWKLYAADIGNVARESSWKFKNDIPLKVATARHSDYNSTGYDRGHLCPAHDRSASQKRMKATFVMSNIAPQTPSLNRVTWYQTERITREAALMFDSVGVVAIPVLLDRDTVFIGKHRLAVPHAFVKAVWRLDNDSVLYSWFIFNE